MRSDVPQGWSPKSIGSLLDWDAPGFWGESPKSGGDPVKVLRSTNFTGSGIPNLDDIALRCFPERIRKQKALQFGDILLERSGGGPNTPVGRVLLFEERDPHFYSNFIQALRVGADADYRFLFYVLWNMHKTGVTSTLQQATTGIRNLSYKDYLAWQLLLPPLAEQRKIAAILTSVDEAIQATEAVIAQTRRVKEGLLQELLTKGIGHTRFKQTEIGEIPETWEVRMLGDYLPKGTVQNGLYRPSSDYGDDGIPIIRIDSYQHGGKVSLSSLKRVNVEGDDATRFLVQDDDILLNRVNSLSHLAKSAIAESIGEPTLFESNMMRIRLNPELGLRPGFLIRVMTLPYARNHFQLRAKKAIAQASVNQQDLRAFPLPIPSLAEQERIEKALALIDGRLDSEVSSLQQVKQLKSGLLQDLLTGRVRVTP